MNSLAIQTLLKEAENLTRVETIELITSLSQQLEQRESKIKQTNLADFFQNSPLVGVEIDLTRQADTDDREVDFHPSGINLQTFSIY
jgi:hypothetical protein